MKTPVLFLGYPPCSTCRKAKKWLEESGIPFEERHIKEHPPTREELDRWKALSGRPLKAFFNTSGLSYRALGLKDKLPSLSREEQLTLLASDGMLVKRPLAVLPDKVLVGFRPAEWESLKADT